MIMSKWCSRRRRFFGRDRGNEHGVGVVVVVVVVGRRL